MGREHIKWQPWNLFLRVNLQEKNIPEYLSLSIYTDILKIHYVGRKQPPGRRNLNFSAFAIK